MFLTISTFLTIFQLTFATDSPNGYHSIDSETLATVYDDTAIKNKQHRVDLQQTINDHLSLKIELPEITLTQMQNDLEEIKAALATQKYVYENITDICAQSIYQFKNVTNPPRIKQSLPTSCTEAFKKNGRNGIYKVKIPDSGLEPFFVYCVKDIHDADASANTSGWLVIQRRQDGSIDFYRNWDGYKQFFGNLEGEFFIGLEKMHALTQSTLHELWIEMEDFEGNKRWAKYSSFAIGAESDDYALNILGAYTGDAGDALASHADMKWTTLDRDNDKQKTVNCAQNHNAAWWYNVCAWCNLNGLYLRGEYGADQHGDGIVWAKWHGQRYSLKYVHMAIRPVQ